jgi:hypothetical protein
VDANTYLEFGENTTCELYGVGERLRREIFRTVYIPHGIVIIYKRFQTLTGVCIPDTTVEKTLSARVPLHWKHTVIHT